MPNLYKQLKKAPQSLAHLPDFLVRGDFTTKYVWVSHHKCATQYVMRVLRAVCEDKKLRAVKCDWREPISRSTIMLNNFLMIQDYSSDIVDIKALKGRGFHVIRDPRDILVSLYFSHRYSHALQHDVQEIADDRRVLSGMDEPTGLIYLMDHSSYFNRAMREMTAWDYHMDNFFETRFERITVEPQTEFAKVFAFLGIEMAPGELDRILSTITFDNLKQEYDRTHTGSETSHYRQGKAGDWGNHLLGQAKEVFKQRYGDLVVRLDYAADTNW